MKIRTREYLLLFFLANAVFGYSQKNKEDKKKLGPSIEVIARSYGDSIFLRWGANTPLAWSHSNRSGFIIERYTLIKDGKLIKDFRKEKVVLTNSPIKPFPLEKWEPLAKKNKYGAIAAQALYGKKFELSKQSSNMMELINKAKELENRFSFALFAADQSLNVADASGLFFNDKGVKKNEKYLYKIYCPDNSYKIDTATIFIGTNDIIKLPKPVGLKAEFSDRVVMLSWNKVYYEHLYTSYIIERSDDGGKNFKRISTLPIINTSPTSTNKNDLMFYADSIPENNKIYQFRVKGVNPFEEESPSSDIIEGIGQAKQIKVIPQIISSKASKDGGIKISWRFPEEMNGSIKEFQLLRSEEVNGTYNSIATIPSTKRLHIDKTAKRRNYYIIQAFQDTIVYSASFPSFGELIDSFPPSPVSGLSGKIDNSGKLTLKWLKGQEEDLYGYKIYMANSKTEDFTQISKEPIKDTIFLDTINIKTLTKKVYFKIISLDENFNQSKFSETFEMNRADIVPPAAPRFDSYYSNDTSIFLTWIPSSSEDVVKHILYRKDKNDSEWKKLKSFDIKDSRINQYLDKALSPEAEYQYSIVAVDESQLESSKSMILNISLIDFGKRKVVEEIKYKIDRNNNQIILMWDYDNKNVDKFLIYRAQNGDPLRLYKSVDKSVFTIFDKAIMMNSTYVYKLRASFIDGAITPFSNEILIHY